MLSVTHTLISLPLGVYLNNLPAIFILSFLLHMITDAIPHWNVYPDEYNKYPVVEAAIDVIFGLVVTYIMIGNLMFSWPVLVAILGANLPDILSAMKRMFKFMDYFIFKWLQPFHYWHNKIQWETRSAARGLVLQIIVVMVAIGLLAQKVVLFGLFR